jgi:hypothetical protein
MPASASARRQLHALEPRSPEQLHALAGGADRLAVLERLVDEVHRVAVRLQRLDALRPPGTKTASKSTDAVVT